jgi:spore coat polysaccharide biosynthesis protein SpsF (cytidylyltransferase family)
MVMDRLRVVACIQARMKSTRLPGKVLLPIAGKTSIERIRDRLREAHEIDETVLVTSTERANDPLVEHAESLGLRVWREESETDLVSRFLHALQTFQADAFVRVTADCPLVDPGLVNEIVRSFRADPEAWDVITNVTPPTWPDGLDLDLFPRSTMERLDAEVPKEDLHREWMTTYVYKHPESFRIKNVPAPRDLMSYRLTLDYPEDLELFNKIFEHFGNHIVGWEEVITWLDEHQDIKNIVAHLIDTVVVEEAHVRSAAYKALTDTE